MDDEITAQQAIPADGWKQEHIGMKVRYSLPLGTMVDDVIIELNIGGSMVIGPSFELGMILARQDYAMQAQAAFKAWQEKIQQEFGDDDDEGEGGIFVA